MTAFRNDLDALSARRDTLESEAAKNLRELTQTRALIDEYTARAKLPVLDNIRVAAPCSADWNKMSGDDRSRACGDCNKSVYNLSGMTRDEAEALIIEKEGKLCVRYFQRKDGTILLKDCSIGISRRRRARIVAGAAVLLAATGVYGANKTRLSAKAAFAHEETDRYVMGGFPTMGQMAIPTPAPPEVDPAQVVNPVIEIKGEL
jgi:hypothetical protein